MNNFAYPNVIKTVYIKVDDAINSNRLREFILNSLSLRNIHYKNTNRIFIYFNNQLKTYIVFITAQKYKNLFLELFSISKEKSTQLYYNNEFFCIFKNNKFFYYQAIHYPLEIEELKELIGKKFHLSIDNVEIVNEIFLKELEKKYTKKTKIFQDINQKENYSFKIYLLYLLLLLSIFYYYVENKEEPQVIQESKYNVKQIKKKYAFHSYYDKYSQIQTLIKKHNLKISNIKFEKNSINMSLYSRKKSQIYSFLDSLNYKLLSNKIIKNNDYYEVVCYVQIF